MKATLLLLGDPRMSGCFACKCPVVNDWQRYSFDLAKVWVWPWECVRQSWRVLLTLRDPSSSSWCSWRGTWRSTQCLFDPANQAWAGWRWWWWWWCQPSVNLTFLPVHRDQGDRVLLVDWLDGGDAFHRVWSHDPLIAGKEKVNLCSVVPLAPEVGQLVWDWDAGLQEWVLSSRSCAQFLSLSTFEYYRILRTYKHLHVLKQKDDVRTITTFSMSMSLSASSTMR